MQQKHTQKVNLDPQPKDLLPRNITNKHEVTFTVLICEHIFRAVQEIELPVTGGRNPPRLQTSSGTTLYAARLPDELLEQVFESRLELIIAVVDNKINFAANGKSIHVHLHQQR
jgi:hypothetical protein